MLYATFDAHLVDGSRLYVWTNEDSEPVEEVRVYDPDGRALGGAAVGRVAPSMPCASVRGSAPVAVIPITRAFLEILRAKKLLADYHLETRAGDVWHPVALVDSGCAAVE